jgi:pimeloyl-ACP methyl ester carboxylesterase
MRVTSLLIGVALIALGWSGAWLSHVSVDYHWKPLLLLVVALLVRTAIALAKGFFVNRLGDIQIYTTADSNSEHFDLHDRILWVVEETLRDVLATTEGGRPYYDRVHILAHSLGSTIAMDALIRIRHSVEAGTLESGTWNRIKSLVTFGTALEKTRFFFSVRNATLSQSFEQWRDDIYGRLFTCDPSVLTSRGKRGPSAPHRIFWANYWYFRDIVANEICTYRATEPGETNAREAICYNVRLRERGRSVLSRPWVHSDYLGDKGFWSGVNYAGKQQVGATEIVMAGCQLRPAGRVREPAVRPRTRVAGTQRG